MNGNELVMAGIRAAGNRGVRVLIAGGVLFSALVLWLLLALFPGTEGSSVRPGDLVRELESHADPTLWVLFLISAGCLLWVIWSALGGAALRSATLDLRGQPCTLPEALTFALRRWSSFFFAPVLLCLGLASGALVVYALSSLTRVPVVGWPLFVLISPVVFLVAFVLVSFVIRWLVGGHLSAPAIASGGVGALSALALGLGYARKAPGPLVLQRLLALLLVLLHSSWRVLLTGAAVLLTFLFIDRDDTSDLAVTCSLVIVFGVGSWLLAWPLSLSFGARTGLYLLHRQELDGIAPDAADRDPEREKSLDELGFELVMRLREEEV